MWDVTEWAVAHLAQAHRPARRRRRGLLAAARHRVRLVLDRRRRRPPSWRAATSPASSPASGRTRPATAGGGPDDPPTRRARAEGAVRPAGTAARTDQAHPARDQRSRAGRLRGAGRDDPRLRRHRPRAAGVSSATRAARRKAAVAEPVPALRTGHRAASCSTRGHLTTGGTHIVRCAGREGPASSILVPKATRAMVTRWASLRPLHGRTHAAGSAAGQVAKASLLVPGVRRTRHRPATDPVERRERAATRALPPRRRTALPGRHRAGLPPRSTHHRSTHLRHRPVARPMSTGPGRATRTPPLHVSLACTPIREDTHVRRRPAPPRPVRQVTRFRLHTAAADDLPLRRRAAAPTPSWTAPVRRPRSAPATPAPRRPRTKAAPLAQRAARSLPFPTAPPSEVTRR